ncbi:sulfite exporter TauE/SafE family protein [Euzebya tangerina]|uniref:sulfite exporter TauE/SafE family protein n=1 Tax=Euzebya tangerina TaxID=591198 RepID=UPI000E324384|nr:sulfite exporter TauE/SafE family protein [Euzebya tangerina]
MPTRSDGGGQGVRTATWPPVSGLEIVFVALAALLGGAAQSILGFGVAFTTVPALALTTPELIPGAPLVAFLPMTVAMAFRESKQIDRDAAIRVAVARVPGIALGTLAVLVLSADGISVAVAVVMLVAVISTGLGWTVSVTPANERLAGLVSGFSGTATGLGGPPLAVLYRHRSPGEVRPTLASIFVPGILLALLGLALTGSLTLLQVQTGLVLAVAVATGMVVATPLLTRLSDETVRAGLLVWAGGGSLAALGQVLLG